MAFDLSTMWTRLLRRAVAHSKAARTMRSTPLRVFTSSPIATSSPLAARRRPFESGTHDALDPLAGVHVLADCHLVARASLELAAHPDVRALGVLAKDDEVDVLRAAGLERDEAIGQRANGADVGVEVEAEAEPEEDVAGVLQAGDARVAESAEEDGAGLRGDAIADVGRERRAVPEVAFGAEVQRPEVQREGAGVAVELEHPRGLRDDLPADAVPGQDGDELARGRRPHVPGRLAHARLSAASLDVTSRALATRGTAG
jgi:hypothetical protein